MFKVEHFAYDRDAEGLGLDVRSTDLELAVKNADDSLGGGIDMGVILIRLAVDRTFDQIALDLGRSEPVEAISMAIAALDDARARYAQLYDTLGVPARTCCALDKSGYRCSLSARHASDHDYSKKL